MERIGSEGQVLRQLDEAALVAHCQELRQRPIEAVAICLLFAYVNPEHEARVREIVERELPGLPVSVSHEVAPIWREYERTSTTIADAYLKPLMGRYVESLTRMLSASRPARPLDDHEIERRRDAGACRRRTPDPDRAVGPCGRDAGGGGAGRAGWRARIC